MVEWTVTNNVLDVVAADIRLTANKALGKAGEVFKGVAYEQCPVSAINKKGYVHLRDTIGYEVTQFSSFYLMALSMWVIKTYAEYVNNGTGSNSRIGPRPFFSNGVLAVGEQWERIVEQAFKQILRGRYDGQHR